ncbi:MAG: cytoplasmic protein [Pelagibacterales bacterium]|nr:cytoplasmic protein [Pelagibacterales bacterium]PPR17191.1 MAG: hypothetical protein CFH33_00061 [Alphaproteobacteria bacterium MarineAlpha9_Bin3]|tara:strand:- start:785 stop:1480 length:696 start_codon:yes stop_codon:yes gene_type:complete
MTIPLMPQATAVWLVENTSLSFQQVGDFCGLHVLEVQGIADEEVATGIKGKNPIASGELTIENIQECEKDEKKSLILAKSTTTVSSKKKKSPRYTPLSRRQDRPNAISWVLKFHPEMSDGQISKLIGTTKFTINQIRDRTHWNIANVSAKDPVMLGLCKQNDLAAAIAKARRSSRWKEMQKNSEINKDNNSDSGIKYGLVRKEDHIENSDTDLDNEDINNLFEDIANSKQT